MQRFPATQAVVGRSLAGAPSLARSDASGIVVAFDPDTGLGSVRGDDGIEYLFHCVEIADGTRTIDVGAPVEFRRLAKLGTYEAGCLIKR
jgi:cold shock CspA family protein